MRKEITPSIAAPLSFRWGLHLDSQAVILMALESESLCFVSANFSFQDRLTTDTIMANAMAWLELHARSTVTQGILLGALHAEFVPNGWFLTAGSEPLALLMTAPAEFEDLDILLCELRRDQDAGFWLNSQPNGWPEAIIDKVTPILLNQLADAYVRTIRGNNHVQRTTRPQRNETIT